MAKTGTPIRYLNFDGLLNNGASDFLLADTDLYACKNVWIYKIGKLEKVPGYTAVRNFSEGYSLTFLHYYYDTSVAANYQLAGGHNGTNYLLKQRTSAAFSTIYTYTANSANTQLSAVNFLGKAFIAGYDGATRLSPVSVDGTTATHNPATDTDLADMPKGKFIGLHDDRLWVFNCTVGAITYPSRVYYSEPVTAGKITWLPATGFEIVGDDDGDTLVGGASALGYMVTLKQRSVWKVNVGFYKKISDTGCDSARSILTIEDTVYWFNRHGFWRWKGTTPQLISERAKEYIDAIDPDNFANVVATEYYKKEYRAFIGDVVVNNILYHNAWFCFDTLRERCYIRCTYHAVTAAGKYIEGDKTRAYFGASNGYLYKFAEKSDRVFSDAGFEIDSFFETKMLDHGVPEDTKFTNHMTVFTKNNSGMKVAVDADNAGEFSVDNEDTINKNVQPLEISASANRYRYRFYEKSDGLSWEFEGFCIETQIKEDSFQ